MHVYHLVTFAILMEAKGKGIGDKSPEEVLQAWKLVEKCKTLPQLRSLLVDPYDRVKLDKYPSRWKLRRG